MYKRQELDYDDYDFVLGNNNSDTKGYAALTNTFKYTSKYDKEVYKRQP